MRFANTLALMLALALMATTGLVAARAAGTDDGADAILRPVLAEDVVVVSDRVVHLGDLFHNIGEKATTPVAYAPRPGGRAIFDARWLYRTARAHKLAWRPLSRNARVTVERDSTVIARDEVEDLVIAALTDQGVDTGALRVEIDNSSFRLHLPVDSMALPVIEDLTVDQRRGRFAAVLAMIGDERDRRVRITGRLDAMTDVPVLRRRINGGDIIAAADVDWVRMPSQSLQKTTILAVSDLVGMTPRRVLRAGQPVRASDVHAPVVVEKGQLVTIVLSTPGMILTARGRALQDGAMGELIRVSNTQSSLVIQATVAAPGEVIVGAPALAY